MTPTDEPVVGLACVVCGRIIEVCAFCERIDRDHAICYRCLRLELRESMAHPHPHGG